MSTVAGLEQRVKANSTYAAVCNPAEARNGPKLRDELKASASSQCDGILLYTRRQT